jgi:hypothetical protein
VHHTCHPVLRLTHPARGRPRRLHCASNHTTSGPPGASNAELPSADLDATQRHNPHSINKPTRPTHGRDKHAVASNAQRPGHQPPPVLDVCSRWPRLYPHNPPSILLVNIPQGVRRLAVLRPNLLHAAMPPREQPQTVRRHSHLSSHQRNSTDVA